MNPLLRTRSSILGASLCVLWAVAAYGQPQIEVTGNTLTVGPKPTTPVGSSVRLDGLGTEGGSTVVFSGPLGDLIRRTLAPGDIPTVYTRRDVAESIGLPWAFTGGLRASAYRGTADPFEVVNSTATKSRFRVFDDLITRHSDTGVAVYEDFAAMGVPLGAAGSRYWRAGVLNGGVWALDMLSNDYGLSNRVLQVDGIGDTGTPTRMLTGPTLQTLQPGRQLFTDLGSYLYPFRALHVGELRAATMVANETQAYTEASLKVGRGSTLTRDLSDTGTYIATKTKFTRYGDWVILRGLSEAGLPQFEVMFVNGAAVADCTGAVTPTPADCFGALNNDYVVQVRRNEDGSGANAWKASAAVVSMDRWIDIFSDASGTVGYGSAVLADRPAAYWNFAPPPSGTNPPSPTPNRSRGPRGYAGATTTLVPASDAGIAGSGWASSNEGPPYGAWVYAGTAQQSGLNQTVMVPEINTSAFDYAMSVEFVFHTGATPTTTYQPVAVWNYEAATGNFAVYHFGTDTPGSTNLLCLFGNVNGAWGGLSPCAALAPTTWYHIVFTWDALNGGRLYVNGGRVGTRTPNPSLGSPRYNATRWPLRVAGHKEAGESVGTHFGELAIFDYELTADQVASHYAALSVSRASTTNGPTIVGWLGGGTNWFDQAPRWAAGNLIGLYDYPTEVYGFAAGDYSKTWIGADASNGFRVMNGSTPMLWADTVGNITINNGTIQSGAYIAHPQYGMQVKRSTAGGDQRAFAMVETLGTAPFGTATYSFWFTGLSNPPTTMFVLGQASGDGSMMQIGEDVGGDGFDRTVRLWNNGSPTLGYTGSGIDLTSSGIKFHAATPNVLTTFVRPELDNFMTLGHPSARWKNVHLALSAIPLAGATGGIVALDPSDLTRLGYVNWGLGPTGGRVVWMRNRSGTGECYIAFIWGLAYETNCT